MMWNSRRSDQQEGKEKAIMRNEIMHFRYEII